MPSTRKTLPPVNGEEPEIPSVPLLTIGKGDEPEPEQWDTLFSVDGKDYQLLTNPPASYLTTYLDIARREGLNVALSWAMEAMLSTGAYQVLLDDPRVSQKALEKIAMAVVMTVQGADQAGIREALANGEDPKVPPSRNGSRRPPPRR